MAKKESNFVNMTVTLLVVAFLASTALGFVYKLTKGPIDKAKKARTEKAIKQVTKDFDNSPSEEMFKVEFQGDSLIFYPAKQGGKLVAMAVESFSNKGFGGRIDVIVGFEPDGTIINSIVLAHKETPGLGDKTEKKKSDWSNQFNGKNPKDFKLMVKKDGGDVVAITAATISSRAYTDAVDRAYKAFMKYMENNNAH